MKNQKNTQKYIAMKNVLTTILIFLISLSISGKPVNQKVAQQIAEGFYSVQSGLKATNISVKEIIPYLYEGETSMYIFSFTTGGFVIVSADDSETPILGYSLKSPVKKEIDNSEVKYLFDLYGKAINLAKSSKIENPEIAKQWELLLKGEAKKTIAAVDPLLTTTWDQGSGYNNLCPSGTPTGCVATAMAQIMYYHKWPATGQGWHKYTPSDNPNFGVQYADFGSVNYDWQNMPNFLGSGSTLTQINAIATLMYHCGVSVDMNYDSDGSGAFSQDVMHALTSYFKYNPTTINIFSYTSTTASTALTKTKSELDQNRPVFYSGGSKADGGHAWVCDGYDASDKLHINWGWSGYYNGYFSVTLMNPANYNFSEYNAIITGIKPGQDVQDILWIKQASGFITASRGIQFISAVNNRIAWAVGYDGSSSDAKVKEYTRTIDGGSTWTSGTINVSGTTDYTAAMISAVNDKKAWVALFGPTGGGKIVKTTDGGSTWVHQTTATFSSPDGFPNVVHFWNENEGFCMGDPNGGYFEIYTTTNGGDTWTRVQSSKIPSNLYGEYGTVGFYDVYGNTVWFATNKGRIYKSTDKGYNWMVYQTPITDASFEVTFRDENVGVIQRRGASGSTTSYKTINGGQNWTQLNPTGNFYTASLSYVPGTNILISSGSNYALPFMGISYSTDDGTTFIDYAEFYKNHQFTAIGAAGENAVWAGGFNSSQYSDGMWHLGSIPIAANFTANKTFVNQFDSTIIFSEYSYGTPETWEWNFGSSASPQTLSGKGPHRIKYMTEGSKTITLTITKGADQHIFVRENYVWVSGPVDVQVPGKEKQIGLYPNPASTFIKLDGFEKGKIRIYNASGVLQWESKNQYDNNSIDISQLASGLYIIKIETPDGNMISKKLTIDR